MKEIEQPIQVLNRAAYLAERSKSKTWVIYSKAILKLRRKLGRTKVRADKMIRLQAP